MAILKAMAIALVAGFLMAAISHASEGEVLRAKSVEPVYRVEPQYPPAALRHHIQGLVRFDALISKDGHIERLRLISGHPLLVQAARQAARQWVFRPTLLHGQAVRVATIIEVQFRLDENGKPLRDEDRNRVQTAVVTLAATAEVGSR